MRRRVFATTSDSSNLLNGVQGVAGSNPAVPIWDTIVGKTVVSCFGDNSGVFFAEEAAVSVPLEFLLDNSKPMRKFVVDSGPHVRFGLHNVK